MLILGALIVSVLFQFGAFFITLSLIRKTKFNISWITISIAFLLMAFRRLSELISIIKFQVNDDYTLFNSWIGVVISLLMFIASFYIRQIFILQSRVNRLRRENESRVLSAIIKTEEKDRQLFARELHDGLAPILSSIKMALSAIDKKTIGSVNYRIMDKTETAVDNAIQTIKEISNKLSPQVIERFGLEKAIRNFTGNIITGDGIVFDVNSNLEGRRFDYNTEIVLYRIVCELVTNTLKHAAASSVEIALFGREDELEMSYSDNGAGFEHGKVKSQGMGLSNIESRVKSLDGQFEMHSAKGQGFYMKITLPV